MTIYTVKVTNGTKRWYLNDQLHCEHGPAIERYDGTNEYYYCDKRHNEHGPAIVYPNGSKYYYLYDKLHNEDGHAVELPDGSKYYYLHGVKYSETEWCKQLNKHKAPKAPKSSCDNKVVEVDGVKYKLVKI